MLDRQIGDAASSVEPIGFRERLRRTDIQAARAAAAMIRFTHIGRQLKRRVDLAQKQPGAMGARHQVCVFPLPAQAGPRRQRLFHHRGGVDEYLDLTRIGLMHPARDPLQALLDDTVVVAALRVDRHRAAVLPVQYIERRAVRAIIHRQRHDGPRFRP